MSPHVRDFLLRTLALFVVIGGLVIPNTWLTRCITTCITLVIAAWLVIF